MTPRAWGSRNQPEFGRGLRRGLLIWIVAVIAALNAAYLIALYFS
jgi:hypothetical protein